MPKQILVGEPRYKKLERIEERYELLIKTWGLFMEAEGRARPLPEDMTKRSFPRLGAKELAEFIRSEHCKGMYPDEVLVELERWGK